MNMNDMRVEAGVQGYFQLNAVKAITQPDGTVTDGDTRVLTDWFPNLVLDSGLNRMATGSFLTGVCVGSGTSEPQITQTGLDSFIARTTTIQGSTSGRQVTSGEFYWWGRVTYRFAQGKAEGNLSEIGVGWANDGLLNRTLIKDTAGNPTTVVILPDEFLDVNFEFRVYPKMTDTVKTIKYQERINNQIVDVSTHEVTIRPLMTSNDIWFSTSSNDTGDRGVTFTGYSVYTGALNDMLTSPGGSTLSGGSLQAEPGDPAERKRLAKYFFDLNYGNGVHSVVVVNTSIGSYKFSYNPPITKTANYQQWHSFGIKWSRYAGA